MTWLCTYWDAENDEHHDSEYISFEDGCSQFDVSVSESQHSTESSAKSIFCQLSDRFQQNEQVDPDTHYDLASLWTILSDENLEDINFVKVTCQN